jgi:uncharacterized membrane protein YtjA (UPF0391 family)
MFFWALIFLVISIVFAVFRFSGSSIIPPTISLISFYSTLFLSFLMLIIGIVQKPPRI